MSVLERVSSHFIPSHENSYRPYLLRRSWLLFFVAIIALSEGLFVSSVVMPQGSDTAGAAAVSMAPAITDANSLAQSLGRQLTRFASEAQPSVPWVLSGVAALIIVALFFAVFVHIQIQHHEMLMGGTAVALFALLLVITNAHIAAML